jgi:hypothetical protein
MNPSKKSSKLKKKYNKPTLKKHNEIIQNTKDFSAAGPGVPAGAQASPTVPGAVVF